MRASIIVTPLMPIWLEAVLNDLQTVGIRARLRPLERAAFFKGYAEKKFGKA
jgi:hypothetical protein